MTYITNKDFRFEVAKGNVSGLTTWNKFGYNADIDTGSAEILASFGGTYTIPTTADTIDIVSTSAQDSEAPATGCHSVVVYGIDENRESQVEVVALDGTAGVTTTSQWLGINRVAPFLCGSSQENVGTITVTHTTSGNTLAEMPASLGVTQQAIFHVQAGHTFLASWLWINVRKLSGGTAPRVTIKGWVFSPVANSNIEIFEARIDTAIENTMELKPTEPFPITEKSVLYFTAETNTNNTTASIRFSGIETPN